LEMDLTKVCCECKKDLTQEEIEYNQGHGLSGYCTEHRRK
jgi:hypothetical protein